MNSRIGSSHQDVRMTIPRGSLNTVTRITEGENAAAALSGLFGDPGGSRERLAWPAGERAAFRRGRLEFPWSTRQSRAS
jgi:hypothetical protein